MPSDTHADHSGEGHPMSVGLIVRAQVLKETLAARAAKADELRRVPDETIADFREALKIDPKFQQPADGLPRLQGSSAKSN